MTMFRRAQWARAGNPSPPWAEELFLSICRRAGHQLGDLCERTGDIVDCLCFISYVVRHCENGLIDIGDDEG